MPGSGRFGLGSFLWKSLDIEEVPWGPGRRGHRRSEGGHATPFRVGVTHGHPRSGRYVALSAAHGQPSARVPALVRPAKTEHAPRRGCKAPLAGVTPSPVWSQADEGGRPPACLWGPCGACFSACVPPGVGEGAWLRLTVAVWRTLVSGGSLTPTDFH